MNATEGGSGAGDSAAAAAATAAVFSRASAPRLLTVTTVFSYVFSRSTLAFFSST